MHIRVIADGRERLVPARAGETLLSALQRNGYEISASCGGFGKCGKCTAEIEENGARRKVKTCETPVSGGMSVYLSGETAAEKARALPPMETDGEDGIGLVLDIGTTTLAFYFVSLRTGEALDVFTALNPQRSFGADVISRVSHADTHGVEDMRACLAEKVNEVIRDFLKDRPGESIRVLAAAGNTVMLHIFAGEPVSGFGRWPFAPVFLETRRYAGEALGIDAREVVLLPSFDAFVGADIVCGAVAADITAKNAILIDLGTNGEILMHCAGELYVTSVAAGPAFEGADIECGTGGVSGAICAVRRAGEGFAIETIGNAPPSGICGAGLTDAAAYMLDAGILDETGAFTQDTDRFYLSENVYISARDVRRFQLAKSAVRSGLEIMLKVAREKGEEIAALYVSGGLGMHIGIESAFRVGLIPPALRGRVIAAGNTAGIGAAMCMLRRETLAKAQALARRRESIDLASRAEFMDLFAENMLFEYGNGNENS